MTTMRAKMKVYKVEKFETSQSLHFHAVGKKEAYDSEGSDENNTYAKWTPNGTCALTVNNPALFDKFTEGDEYYLDFTPAKK